MNLLLASAKKTSYYPLFYTALFTGMRRSELLALRWSDIDLLLCLLYVNRSLVVIRSGIIKSQVVFKTPKTANSRRPIDITPSNALVLKAHKDSEMARTAYLNITWTEDRLAFCDWDGSPYKPDRISHAWHNLIVREGLEGVRLHDTRHTMATLMLKDGVHPKLVSERLGHASITTTLDTYSHCIPGLQKALAKRFDELVLPEETKEESKVEKEVNMLLQK
jgi:integrase